MTLNQACLILNVELPDHKLGLMSKMDKEIFFDEVKEKYLNLIKLNHPDLGGQHDNSVNIIEAFQFLRKQIKEKHKLTITEWFDRYHLKQKEKKQQSKSGPKPKEVYQYDLNKNFIKKWDSISEIKKELNFDQGAISRVIKGKYRQHKGFIWSDKELNNK